MYWLGYNDIDSHRQVNLGSTGRFQFSVRLCNQREQHSTGFARPSLAIAVNTTFTTTFCLTVSSCRLNAHVANPFRQQIVATIHALLYLQFISCDATCSSNQIMASMISMSTMMPNKVNWVAELLTACRNKELYRAFSLTVFFLYCYNLEIDLPLASASHNHRCALRRDFFGVISLPLLSIVSPKLQLDLDTIRHTTVIMSWSW